MTIGGWFLFVLFSLVYLTIAIVVCFGCEKTKTKVLCIFIASALVLVTFFGFRWFFTRTASGQRMMVDQKSELANGLERTITIYTADGRIMARYEGRIDIEANDGGYVVFDYDGARYIYYNCFVESVAKIE